jgi:hypothetical protein
MHTDTATSTCQDNNSPTPPDNNQNSTSQEMAQPNTPGNHTGPNLENPQSPQRQHSGFTPYDLTFVRNRRFLAS